MLSTFLLPSAPQNIFCSSSVVSDINARQSTLSEQLFDAAEEHALTVLQDAWNDASTNDLSVFRKVSITILLIAVTDAQETLFGASASFLYRKLSNTADQSNRTIFITSIGRSFLHQFLEG